MARMGREGMEKLGFGHKKHKKCKNKAGLTTDARG